jgi:hypothetical protein
MCRRLDDGKPLEILLVCTDGSPNACTLAEATENPHHTVFGEEFHTSLLAATSTLSWKAPNTERCESGNRPRTALKISS